MFSGIVVSKGTVKDISLKGENGQLAISAPDFMQYVGKSGRTIGIGESILVSGVCLTVIEYSDQDIVFDLASETLRKTKFNELNTGDNVNLEASLRLNDTLSGHLVAGHVDGIGKIVGRSNEGDTLVLSFSYPRDLAPYLVSKGSISIDGVSLTVGEVTTNDFKVYIVPHTALTTTLGSANIGDSVNLEIDLIARYVERQLAFR